MADAQVIIEGQSNVGAVVSADLAKAKTALSGVESGGAAASKAADGTGLSFEDLGKAALGLGAALGSVKVAIDVAAELDQMGASALRAKNSLDIMTSGDAQSWMDDMTAATHGLMDDEDAATLATQFLTTGMASSAKEAAHFVEVSTTLGAAIKQIDAKTAGEELASMFASGNVRAAKDFGISVIDLRNRMDELKKSGQGLTDQQILMQAFFEQADPLSAKFSSTLNDQAANIDKLAVAWTDAKEELGKYIAKAADPAIQGLTRALTGTEQVQGFSDSVANVKAQVAASTPDFRDYVNALEQMGINMQTGRGGMVQYAAEFDHLRAVAVSSQMEMTTAARNDESATGDFAAQERAAADEALALADAVNQVAGTQLGLELNINNLIPALGDEQQAFRTGLELLKGHNLTEMETLNLTEQLGLATGQLSVKQIEQAETLRTLGDLFAGGKISAEGLKGAMDALAAGADPAKVKMEALNSAIDPATMDLVNAGIITREQAIASLTTKANEAVEAQSKLNEGLDKTKAADTTIKMDKSQVDITNTAITHTQSLLEYLASHKFMTNLLVNVSTAGATMPPGMPSPVPAQAEGGVSGGGLTLVGEKGPELVMMPAGARVFNADDTSRALRSGQSGGSMGGTTNNIYVTAHDVTDTIDAINREMRARGQSLAGATA